MGKPQKTPIFKIYTKRSYNNGEYNEKMYYITILLTRLFTNLNYCCYFDLCKMSLGHCFFNLLYKYV